MKIIGNRYQLQYKLGQGGMGAVYCALDKLSGEQVALKQVILPASATAVNATPILHNTPHLRLTLAREFQTLAGLRHPYIISVLDYGFDEAQRPYFTMTYLPSASPSPKPHETNPSKHASNTFKSFSKPSSICIGATFCTATSSQTTYWWLMGLCGY